MTKLFAIVASVFVIFLLNLTTVLAQSTTAVTLDVLTPSDGQTIYGNKVPILFNIENFEIVDYELNSTPTAGQGHIHVWLDDEEPSPVSATKVVEDTFTFSDVPFGEHTLMTELVGNTHKSLVPPQKITNNFSNTAITTPEAAAASGFDKNTALVILIVVALVIVAAWWYTKEEDEEMEEEAIKPKKKTVKSKDKKGNK